MRILQLCPKPPSPPSDGGMLAMNSVTEGLIASGQEVRVLTIETEKHPFLPDRISSAYNSATKIEAVFVDTRVKMVKALLNLFSSSSYNVDRFYSVEFENKLTKKLKAESFDIIQLEGLYMAPYIDVIRKNSKAKIVLRAHNVESALWKRRTDQEKNPFKKSWFNSLTKKLHRYESEALQKVDAIIPITREDEVVLKQMLNGNNDGKSFFVLPFAMVLPEQAPSATAAPGTVFHIGSMDWAANIEGVKWLVDEVWPRVISKVPGAELHLAGKQLQKDDERFQGKNISIHGEVDNATDFMNAWSIMVIPLLAGGGMRIKLVEGMALGKAIITTSIGAEGTDVKSGEQVLLANSTEEFATAICDLLNNDIYTRELGIRAKQFAKTYFDRASASEKLNEFYSSLFR